MFHKMVTNQGGTGQSIPADFMTHKRCTICNVPFFNQDLILHHYRHHMTPKVCMLVTTNEDGQQKYIEISQHQALSLSNRGTVSMVQSGLSTGQTQYVLADQTSYKTATINSEGHLIACSQPTDGLGQDVELVEYVDSTGQELSQEDVQYYALDGQEYSVIQGNEEIVVSTEPRLHHEEQHLQQTQTTEDHSMTIEVAPVKTRGGRANPKRKKYN